MNSSPTIETINMICEKAKNKKDGIYLFRGVSYRVFDCKFTHYAYRGKVFERFGYFVVDVGSYSGYSDEAKKLLKTIK